jgi:hypothetical protein
LASKKQLTKSWPGQTQRGFRSCGFQAGYSGRSGSYLKRASELRCLLKLIGGNKTAIKTEEYR